jgi:nickel-dependent lactate racemase
MSGSLCLNLSNAAVIGDYRQPHARPLDDPAAAVAAALTEPLDFPPLSSATVPGDRIAIAVDPSVAPSIPVVSGVVHALLQANPDPAEIAIVWGCQMQNCSADELVDSLSARARAVVRVEIHEPHDRENLVYLAASKEGKPIYVNRTLTDADVVIPLGVMRLDLSLGYLGVHGCLFPMFSDAATQSRFRTPNSKEWSTNQCRLREEAEEAVWLLGVQFTVQVIPGPGESLLHVLAGDAHSVYRRGRELCREAWVHEAPRRAKMVVATIEGGPEQQTWENFARALYAASQAVDDDGTIVLCTELHCPPGPSLRRLSALEDFETIRRQLRNDRTDDALSASLLLESRERRHVFLLSNLDGDTVEGLGIGHVASADDVDRLGRQHESCILLSNAQHAMIATPQ